MQYKFRLLMPTVVLVLCFGAWASAQGSCPALVTRALEAIDSNCDGLGRNSACYGFNLVQASFVQNVADDFFTQPADVSALADIASIKTAPLDEANGHWGVAVMSVQANIPNALPGQAVTFVLLGDTQVTNDVTPENTFIPAEPIDVIVSENTRTRSGPGFNFNVLAVAQANTTLPADALSADGEWVRVVYNEVPAWVNRGLLQANDAIASLPVFDGTQRTPMQAFYLQTGVGATSCEEADNVLMVQGPKNIKIDLTVNGADFTIGSTVLFETPTENSLQVTVLDGEAIAHDAGENGEDVVIPTGYTSQACLSDGDIQEVSCAFSEPEEVPYEELGEDLCALEQLPASVLNYEVNVLCGDESLQEYLGEILPTETPRPDDDDSDDDDNDSNDGDVCGGLSLVSPLGAMPFGSTTFQWTNGNRIDQYILSFYGLDGSQVASYFVGGDQTQFTVDTTTIPQGDRVEWEVLGLINGELVCGTQRSGILQREVNPNPPPQDTALNGSWSCSPSNLDVPFSYAGADPGDTVTLIWEVNATPPFSGGTDVFSGSSNSTTLNCAPCTTSNITGSLSASPSGKTYSMPTLSNCGNF
jgi:hypothetical protein